MYVFVNILARTFAVLGGVVLFALVLVTCLSIAGRSVNGLLHSETLAGIAPELTRALIAAGIGPINGDFELVEAGMAFAIFAFLPLCQFNAAHAFVDVFTSRLPDRANRALRMIIEIVFASVLIVIALQLFQGMLGKRQAGQTTFLLEFPVWWGYASGLPGAVVAAFVAVYMAILRVFECLYGRVLLPESIGDE